MKEQRSEDGKEFLVLVIAVMHELFSYMEISQWARGSTVLSTMNEAEKHLAIRLAAFYSSYAYVICDLAHRIMKDAYLQTDAVCLFPAYDIWMSFLDRLQDYIGLIADRRYVMQIEAQTKNLLHNAMDKLCNELGMHCIALKIRDKFIDPPDLLIIPEHS
ncbi:hypothetical protein T05_9507 [Trichinella murrelli]|uniref:Uncharacterized protein n=1 Tax=Trichinella murrelli TaxID=144512 RepID=A0A0V0T996_9BILA|nr:hypothetical protein T05_9507 [Trichinella murrelli]